MTRKKKNYIKLKERKTNLIEKWQTESLVKLLREETSAKIGKPEALSGALESSSSFKVFNLLKVKPERLIGETLSCKHSRSTKSLTSGGNKLTSFAKNLRVFNLFPKLPNDSGIKLNTFLYTYNPCAVLGWPSIRDKESSIFLPDTSITESKSSVLEVEFADGDGIESESRVFVDWGASCSTEVWSCIVWKKCKNQK